jgi:signal transduction histidine kinase
MRPYEVRRYDPAMHPTASVVPLIKRVPPGVWTVLAWCAGMSFTFLTRFRLPGEAQADTYLSVLFLRWDGLTCLGLATVLVLRGAWMLTRRPLAAMTWILIAMPIATMTLSVGAIQPEQFLTADVALYFVAASRPRGTGSSALTLSLGTVLAHLVVRLLCGWDVSTSGALSVLLVTVIAWLLGDSARRTRAETEQLTRTTARQAVAEERLRIAREMHDQVAHSIGIVALQAGAARRVIDTQPERARAALGEIELAGRETLAGLRRMLGALRTAERGDPDGRSGQGRPGPADPAEGSGLGLADVDRLVAAAGAVGVEVRLWRSGTDRALPAETGLAAYRIVQEAVTNVVKHAGTDACDVRLDITSDGIAVEVTDTGRGPAKAAAGSGFGLLGMRERVALLNGSFTAGPRPGGGFRIAADLPVPAAHRLVARAEAG